MIHRGIGNVILMAMVLFAAVPAASDPAETENPVRKISRWESDFSLGKVSDGRVGFIKFFNWYPFQKIFCFGLSLDCLSPTMAFSIGGSLNLPLPVVSPFVTAGVGTSLTRGRVTNYGGGVKIRIWPRIGVMAEYRKYSRGADPSFGELVPPRDYPHYVGVGITYLY